MISLPREKAWEKWDEFWNEANKEFFKVEDIQDYTAEDNDQKSSLHLWLDGHKRASIDTIYRNKSEWAEQTSSKDIRKIRVHVVDEPYTEYLKWEIEHYKIVNIPLGKERTFLVNRKDVPNYVLGDFMMFDDRDVTKSHYSLEGRMESMDIYENESIEKFITAKAQLMQFAKEIIV
ncbi:MAG TPA: hypothetical protein VIM37_01525 [Candidatus Microsaccharimonas sp.]|jgi:hypothetical protein